MKRFKLLFIAVVGVFAIASIASSAALASGPTLLFTGSERTILLTSRTAEPSNTTKTELQSSVTNLKGEGVLLELTLLQTSAGLVGTYLALFLKIETSAGIKCNTRGDREAEVLLPSNTAEGVYYTTSPLKGGIVFNVREFEMECGGATFTIKGSMLGTVETAAGQVSEVKGGLYCSSTAGKPEKTEYTNPAGTRLNTKLEVTAARRTVEGCELIGTTNTFVESFVVESGSSAKTAELMI
jgi:hypothetical protein